MNKILTGKAKTNKITADIYQLFIACTGIFLFIVILTVSQDLLESKRQGYSFYFNESLLFKTIWLPFIPLLPFLYHKLQKTSLDTGRKVAFFIVMPIIIHLLVIPFFILFFSILFYEGRYDLYKAFSYTLANDAYKPIIIYTGFVLGYRFLSETYKDNTDVLEGEPHLNHILVNNGKENIVVLVEEIIQITSATPYVFIHLDHQKHLYSDTLKSIGSKLQEDVFVQVHKTTIVNMTKITSFRSRLNGDYDLQLHNGDTVRLSRTYAPNFKAYFKATHQDTV